MPNDVKVICEVCRKPNFRFKVLDCGHEFCNDCCVEELSNPLVPSGKLFASTTVAQRLTAPVTTECPKCPTVTTGPIDALKTHLIGNIVCCQCDRETLTAEFRWCHACDISVCSVCFIDKHINADGISFHVASEWDSYESVNAAVGRLALMSANHTQITDKCKADVAKYLNGLKIHLAQKIDAIGNENKDFYASTANEIAQAYGISSEEIRTTNPIPDGQFQYIFNEAKKIADITNPRADLAEVRFQQLPYERLEKTFLKETITSLKQPEHHRLSHLQSKLINTEFVGLDQVSCPIDLAVLSSTEAIVLDSTGPYHYCNSMCELIPVLLEHAVTLTGRELSDFMPFGYAIGTPFPVVVPVFRQVLLMPPSRNQAMVVGSCGGVCKFVLLDKKDNKFKQRNPADGKLSWPLPGSNKVVASTKRVFTFSSNCLYAYNSPDKMEFSLVFKATDNTQFTELCYVQEERNTTDFYLIGTTSQHLEILRLASTDNSLVSWRCVNLTLLCPDTMFSELMMCAYGSDGFYLVWDRQSTKLFTWNVTNNDFTMITDLRTKSPQVIQFCENYMYMLLREMDVNRIERIKL